LDCIGGYTSQHWESGCGKNGKYKADSSDFLFNLTRSIHFPSKGTGKDIMCRDEWGPCFKGAGKPELVAYAEPFNVNHNCMSIVNQPGYNIPFVNGMN
jgi:hypothetical protein